jgi:hypothetical protein
VFGNPQRERGFAKAEAVTVACVHHEQFLAGVALLANPPVEASDADYRALQDALGQQAPDISAGRVAEETAVAPSRRRPDRLAQGGRDPNFASRAEASLRSAHRATTTLP